MLIIDPSEFDREKHCTRHGWLTRLDGKVGVTPHDWGSLEERHRAGDTAAPVRDLRHQPGQPDHGQAMAVADKA